MTAHGARKANVSRAEDVRRRVGMPFPWPDYVPRTFRVASLLKRRAGICARWGCDRPAGPGPKCEAHRRRKG